MSITPATQQAHVARNWGPLCEELQVQKWKVLVILQPYELLKETEGIHWQFNNPPSLLAFYKLNIILDKKSITHISWSVCIEINSAMGMKQFMNHSATGIQA